MFSPVDQYKARLDKATASKSSDGVSFVAAIAADSNGTLLHKIESGQFIPHENNPSRNGEQQHNFTADTVCWIASCTKLMTTIAVLQCVERGLLSLDDDVADTWLPEFKRDVQILVKIDEDTDGNEVPIYKQRTHKLTLRHLLTHASGIAYEFTHPKLQGWRSVSSATKEGRALARSSDLTRAMRVPLLFEPGTAWVYGYGLDWAGQAVMRATKQNLEEYMTENIWAPLGMRSTTFSLERHRNDLYARYTGMTIRDDEGNIESGGDGGPIAKNIERTHYGGGGGCFSTANDYIKLLSSILNTVNDSSAVSASVPRLITPQTARDMFRSHLSDASRTAMEEMVSNPMAFGLAGNMSNETQTSFGLGGIVNLSDIPSSGRAAGGMQWGGLPNLHWWISPKDGLCGCYFSQMLPPGDVLSFQLYREFEKAVLEEEKQKKQKGAAKL